MRQRGNSAWLEIPSPVVRCDTARCRGESSKNRRCLAARGGRFYTTRQARSHNNGITICPRGTNSPWTTPRWSKKHILGICLFFTCTITVRKFKLIYIYICIAYFGCKLFGLRNFKQNSSQIMKLIRQHFFCIMSLVKFTLLQRGPRKDEDVRWCYI